MGQEWGHVRRVSLLLSSPTPHTLSSQAFQGGGPGQAQAVVGAAGLTLITP